MLAREDFLKHLRDALNRLQDPNRLRQNPLAALFGVDNRFDTPSALQRILGEKRRVMRQTATIELYQPEVKLEQVGGLEVLKAWLRARVMALGEEARRFGLPEPRGMLVCGVQGCGKSLVARQPAMYWACRSCVWTLRRYSQLLLPSTPYGKPCASPRPSRR